MAQEKKVAFSVWRLFFSILMLSSFTFGGGFVIITLMKRKFVDEYHWLEEKEILDMTALAQSAPGPIAVNGAIMVGYRLDGVRGVIAAILGAILPPLVILSVVSHFYDVFRDNAVVASMLKAMQAGIAAVIADVVISMGTSVVKLKKIVPIILMIGAFAAVYFFKINVIYVILFCGVVGAVMVLVARGKGMVDK